MPQIRHVHCAAGSQWPSPRNITFLMGGGEETPLTGGIGGKGGSSDGAHHLRLPPSNCTLLQITWQDTVGIGWWLVGSGSQTQEGAKEVGAVVAGAGEVGGGCFDFGTVLCWGGVGGPFIWVVDLGYAPTHWKDTGWIPPQGGLQVDGEE